MMPATSRTTHAAELVRPQLRRPESMRLAATEYERFADVVAGLSHEDWTRPTDCPDWTVRQMVAHVIGMAELAASPLEQRRQEKAAKQHLVGAPIDALTGVQVRKHENRPSAELVRLAGVAGRRGARGRRFAPWFIRRSRFHEPQSVNGVDEFWTVGFLTDVILTRDTWMHRIDVSRATGRDVILTSEHDGCIVADVVAEWTRRHGQPYTLVLDGPAGGTFTNGSAGPDLHLDAVEFCRTLSGRTQGSGLLATQVPF